MNDTKSDPETDMGVYRTLILHRVNGTSSHTRTVLSLARSWGDCVETQLWRRRCESTVELMNAAELQNPLIISTPRTAGLARGRGRFGNGVKCKARGLDLYLLLLFMNMCVRIMRDLPSAVRPRPLCCQKKHRDIDLYPNDAPTYSLYDKGCVIKRVGFKQPYDSNCNSFYIYGLSNRYLTFLMDILMYSTDNREFLF